MGHARKQLFFGKEAFPSRTCPICNSTDADTWLYILLKCKQQHIHALITKRHNRAVWEIRKLIVSARISRYYTLMNVGTHNDLPQENTVPPWLLSYICGTQRYHCNARLKPDILCIIGHSYNHPPRIPYTRYHHGGKHRKVDNLWSLHPFIANELTTCWYHGNARANIGEQKRNYMEQRHLFYSMSHKISICLL